MNRQTEIHAYEATMQSGEGGSKLFFLYLSCFVLSEVVLFWVFCVAVTEDWSELQGEASGPGSDSVIDSALASPWKEVETSAPSGPVEIGWSWVSDWEPFSRDVTGLVFLERGDLHLWEQDCDSVVAPRSSTDDLLPSEAWPWEADRDLLPLLLLLVERNVVWLDVISSLKQIPSILIQSKGLTFKIPLWAGNKKYFFYLSRLYPML